MSQSTTSSHRRKIITALLILGLISSAPGYSFLRASQAHGEEMQAYAVAKDAQADLQTTQDALTELSQNHTNEAIMMRIKSAPSIIKQRAMRYLIAWLFFFSYKILRINR